MVSVDVSGFFWNFWHMFFFETLTYVYNYTYSQDFGGWHHIDLSHKPPQKAAQTTKESDEEIMGRFQTLRIQVCPKEGIYT